MKPNQKKAIDYYNKFANVYDWLSPKWYYKKARIYAISQLNLNEDSTVLNIPCGTGQNFDFFQNFLRNKGYVIAIDLSEGMLEKAQLKISENHWDNINIIKEDATKINADWLARKYSSSIKVDAVLCDLGLSGFPNWKEVIDNLYELLAPQGRFVIMDWYLPKPTLRGKLIKWIGKGEVDRPIYQYLQSKTDDFSVNTTFNRGGVFVATGIKS